MAEEAIDLGLAVRSVAEIDGLIRRRTGGYLAYQDRARDDDYEDG